jgi:uncharacterized surface protein with fasciclin (FAS1) repeats
MKKITIMLMSALSIIAAVSCNDEVLPASEESTAATTTPATGQSGVSDDVSQKNVVQVAVGSKDHSTFVKAVQQAKLVDALSNVGPFTVFAPVNAAFDKLPAGALFDLMKPENEAKLADILQYHVSLGVFKEDMLQDGQTLGQANGGNIKISKNGTDIIINNSAKVIAAIPASNDLIYVVDAVLLPGS